MSTTTVHLVRHGHVENPGRVLYGRLPGFVLSETGRRQAAVLADHFGSHPLTAVVASPLERAQETAVAVAEPHGLKVGTDARLIEATNVFEGVAGGISRHVLRHPGMIWALRDQIRPSWGERYIDMAERVRMATADVRDRYEGGEIVLVSHQAPIWVARLAFEQRRLAHYPGQRHCALASVTTLRFDDGQPVRVTYEEPAAHVLTGVEIGPPGA